MADIKEVSIGDLDLVTFHLNDYCDLGTDDGGPFVICQNCQKNFILTDTIGEVLDHLKKEHGIKSPV